MDVLEAIYNRRSVRSDRSDPVERATVETLLEAVMQAPSAMNAQPWAFAVFQDRDLLTDLSTRAKAHLLETYAGDARLERYRETLSDPEFDIFYGAGTLVLICTGESGLIPTRTAAWPART